LGSFFNVLISRLPLKQSILFPGSHCVNCNRKIPFYQNIPILSYIVLRGKCSKCGASIHWHHLVVEVVTPILYIILFLQYGLTGILFYKYALLFSLLIPIFFIDAYHQIIPHVLSIPILVLGFLFALVPGNDVGIVISVLTALFVFCFLLLLAYGFEKIRGQEGLGGGDIWLLTGLAAYLGLQGIPFVFLMAAAMGIIYFLFFIRDTSKQFAFGTFIVLAAIIWTLVGGDYILSLIPVW